MQLLFKEYEKYEDKKQSKPFEESVLLVSKHHLTNIMWHCINLSANYTGNSLGRSQP